MTIRARFFVLALQAFVGLAAINAAVAQDAGKRPATPSSSAIEALVKDFSHALTLHASVDGKHLAAWKNFPKSVLTVWSLEKLKERATFDSPRTWVRDIDIAPSGPLLVALYRADDEKNLGVYDLMVKKAPENIKIGVDQFAMTAGGFLANGKYLSWDKNDILVFDPADPKSPVRLPLATFKPDAKGIVHAAVHARHDWLAMSYVAGPTEVRNTSNFRASARKLSDDVAHWLRFSGDGSKLLVATTRELSVFDVKSWKRVAGYQDRDLETFDFKHLSLSHDGMTAAAFIDGDDQEVFQVFDLTSGALKSLPVGIDAAKVRASCFLPDGRLVVSELEKPMRVVDFTAVAADPKPSKSASLTKALNDLSQWEVVRGDWKQKDGRIIGAGNSRINFRQTYPNDFTFRCKLLVNGPTNPRIRFGSFHFGYEGRNKQLFLHGPKATGTPLPFEFGQSYAIEVRMKGDQATLMIDEKLVATSNPKVIDERFLAIEGGGRQSESSAEFSELELITPPDGK